MRAKYRIPLLLGVVTFAIGCSCAHAQQHASPYVGFQQRTIKALSDQELADLRSGRGMGLALAAELNGYPGPVHVLDLADRLDLSAAQRSKIQELFSRMKAETIPLGEHLIVLETELDQQFALKSATESSVAGATAAIGATQAALRNVHLRYHLLTLEALTPEQNHQYAEARGYAGSKQVLPEHGAHPR